jgi:hypothetical protein
LIRIVRSMAKEIIDLKGIPPLRQTQGRDCRKNGGGGGS